MPNPLMHKIKDKVSSGPGEHILNILKAGLATTPFCGGISSLVTDYIPNSKLNRLEDFSTQLAVDLTELQSQINEDKINTDEFAFIFEKCYRGVAENYQKEKIESFRGILLNTAIGSSISEDEKEFFLSLVTNLSIVHMKVLKFLAFPNEYLEENNIPKKSIQGGFSQFFPTAIPEVSLEVIKSAFGDLYQYGCINIDKSIFNTFTSGGGLELLRGRVTAFGMSFINFCKKPK